MIIQSAPLGFSLNPFHYVKKAAIATEHGAVRAAKATGRATVRTAKTVGHDIAHPVSGLKDLAKVAVLPVVVLNKAILSPILHVALTPVRHKVDTMKDRRAKKIAWDARKSKAPTPAEREQAKQWTKGYLKHQVPPFGLMLSMLAGPPLPGPVWGEPRVALLGDPTTATIVASVPTLLAIIDKLLSRANKSGEAPANLTTDAAAAAAASPGMAPGAPGGGRDAADAGGDGGGGAGVDDGSGGGDGSGGAGQLAKKMGISKKQLMIGGAVVGGLALVLLLMPSSKKS